MITLVAFLISLFGCINWLAIGMLQYDIVAGFFGTQASMFSRIIYIFVGFSAIYLSFQLIKNKGRLYFSKKKEDEERSLVKHSEE
ncbi:MAG: DUF378 domain-containing protein [Clostridia bacterium]|nr:DUF378 domain-containing protein [Clostridia bacterium]